MLQDESDILMLIFRISMKNRSWYKLNCADQRRLIVVSCNLNLGLLFYSSNWNGPGMSVIRFEFSLKFDFKHNLNCLNRRTFSNCRKMGIKKVPGTLQMDPWHQAERPGPWYNVMDQTRSCPKSLVCDNWPGPRFLLSRYLLGCPK